MSKKNQNQEGLWTNTYTHGTRQIALSCSDDRGAKAVTARAAILYIPRVDMTALRCVIVELTTKGRQGVGCGVGTWRTCAVDHGREKIHDPHQRWTDK